MCLILSPLAQRSQRANLHHCQRLIFERASIEKMLRCTATSPPHLTPQTLTLLIISSRSGTGERDSVPAGTHTFLGSGQSNIGGRSVWSSACRNLVRETTDSDRNKFRGRIVQCIRTG